MRAKPTTTVTFACSYGRCSARVTAPLGSLLEALNICQACFEVRKAKGLAEQRKADAEVKRV